MTRSTTELATNEHAIAELRRTRPTSRLLRWSVVGIALLMVGSWIPLDVSLDDLFSERRQQAIARFFEDIRPAPLRDTSWDFGVASTWFHTCMNEGGGWKAAETTLAVSILAIVLAALIGALLALPAARNVMAKRPFAAGGTVGITSPIVACTRFVLVLLRCLPEYLLAFLFIGMFGLSAVPAVLALAIHNAGILGRLNAEVIENLPSAPLRSLRAAGGTRRAIAVSAIYPLSLPRGLLYFFYRWETCIRESTVLGLLSIATLGALVADAEARMRFDRMFLFVMVGAVMVVVVDLLSAVVRAWVRQAR